MSIGCAVRVGGECRRTDFTDVDTGIFRRGETEHDAGSQIHTVWRLHHPACRTQASAQIGDENSRGGIDRDSMAIRTRIRVTARSQSEAKSIGSQIRTVVRGGDVYVEGPRNDDEAQWSASIYAMVPRKSDLRVGTRNGPLSVEDVQGDMD